MRSKYTYTKYYFIIKIPRRIVFVLWKSECFHPAILSYKMYRSNGQAPGRQQQTQNNTTHPAISVFGSMYVQYGRVFVHTQCVKLHQWLSLSLCSVHLVVFVLCVVWYSYWCSSSLNENAHTPIHNKPHWTKTRLFFVRSAKEEEDEISFVRQSSLFVHHFGAKKR